MQRIDFETLSGNTLISFQVRVTDPDPQHVDYATVTVNITDANDNPPRVSPSRMTVNLSESTDVGTAVFQSFVAVDDDSLEQNKRFQ